MSRKPAVVISAVLAPLRSSTVLIAMVEPCSSSSMAATSQRASVSAGAAPSGGCCRPLPEADRVGEGPADIDGDDAHGRLHTHGLLPSRPRKSGLPDLRI